MGAQSVCCWDAKEDRMDYRCALVGCGPRAHGHAQAYSLVTRGRLVACCDLAPTRLEAFGEQYDIPNRYADLDEMLAAEKPDLVHLVTKPDLRVPLMSRLAEAGVPAVLVEKPVCVEARDYKALRGLAARGPTKFAVNLQLRHHPLVLEFLEAVRAHAVGDVRFIDASAGLPVAGQGVHILDLMFAFAGYAPVERVVGIASGYDDIDGTHPSPNTLTAVVTFANGVRGVLQAGEGYPVFEPDPAVWMHKRIAVCGTHGYLHWRMAGWERSLPDGTVGRGPNDYAAQDVRGQAALTDALLDWIADDAAVAPTNLGTALDEWLVVLACYASALTSRPVDLPFDPPDDLLDRYRQWVHDSETAGRW
jgi:predicted dehydrogenase